MDVSRPFRRIVRTPGAPFAIDLKDSEGRFFERPPFSLDPLRRHKFAICLPARTYEIRRALAQNVI
jgi:hypothetical protein